jgi:hypothetical protein
MGQADPCNRPGHLDQSLRRILTACNNHCGPILSTASAMAMDTRAVLAHCGRDVRRPDAVFWNNSLRSRGWCGRTGSLPSARGTR